MGGEWFGRTKTRNTKMAKQGSSGRNLEMSWENQSPKVEKNDLFTNVQKAACSGEVANKAMEGEWKQGCQSKMENGDKRSLLAVSLHRDIPFAGMPKKRRNSERARYTHVPLRAASPTKCVAVAACAECASARHGKVVAIWTLSQVLLQSNGVVRHSHNLNLVPFGLPNAKNSKGPHFWLGPCPVSAIYPGLVCGSGRRSVPIRRFRPRPFLRAPVDEVSLQATHLPAHGVFPPPCSKRACVFVKGQQGLNNTTTCFASP